METKKVIDKFEDEFFFLSNYFPCKVEFEGNTFLSSEAAYQSQKCPSRVKEFLNLEADAAKKLGKTVEIREDWEQKKINIMRRILVCKFIENSNLGDKLIATAPAKLIEGNWWNDTFWGVCNGVGSNNLGISLELVRTALIKMKEEGRWPIK